MWTRFDFEDIESLYIEDAEEYTDTHPNRGGAETFLTAIPSLHDFQIILEKALGSGIEKEHEMQLIYLPRGIQALKSIYWLVKHHCYTACYGRIRFLLELYLVVREFNREKEKTRKKWIEMEKEMRENDYGPYDTLPITEYFSGKRRQLKGDFVEQEDMYRDMYDRISRSGSHPHSIQSAMLDRSWDKIQERDVLQFGLIFVYALAAQYRRTFEDSKIESVVHEEMDDIMVQVLYAHGHLPLFLEEDLDYGSQI